MKYRTHPEFERGAAIICLLKPAVWRQIGRKVTPDALNTTEAIQAFALAADVAKISGTPGGLAVVYQAAAGRVEDGS